MVTDLGQVTTEVRHFVRGLDIAVVETNHDLELLVDGPYPWELKQRIRGTRGHLSNSQGMKLAEDILDDTSGKACVVLGGHLSEKNNSPSYAQSALDQLHGISQRPLYTGHITQKGIPGIFEVNEKGISLKGELIVSHQVLRHQANL